MRRSGGAELVGGTNAFARLQLVMRPASADAGSWATSSSLPFQDSTCQSPNSSQRR
jgi:hypothetical protein